MNQETWEKIEKEFEKEFPERFWVGEDPDNVKQFWQEKLEEREKEILEEIEKGLKDFRANCKRLEKINSPIQILDTSKNFFISKIKPLLKKVAKNKELK